ncbi:MAG: single-stranded-DNA-specific exonuclease RecJ [Acidobacteria bacterium]|nr:single-stranded-DNA-specific exonuclease RecJ [Acidobacteriota bacterium]
MRRRWVEREFDAEAAARIQAELGAAPLVARLLTQRGVRSPDQAAAFLSPSLDALHDGLHPSAGLLGLSQGVERLRRAIAGNERILVYGDYDVDGTTSVVLLRKAIELAGGRADYHVPHRLREGYGMRADVIERAAADQVKLLISVDTGIRERHVVEQAQALGIDCIITDHHLPEEAVPPALAVINPNQPGCPYPDKNLCGVGIAFKLSHALLASLGWPAEKLRRTLESMLMIVAIGTIADLVPLAGENRVFASIGLRGLYQARNPGLRALLDVAGLGEKLQPSAGDIGFRVGPRMNAAGRMDTARAVVELFGAVDEAAARPIAEQLDALNAERQATEESVVQAILEKLQNAPPPDVMPFLVVEGEGWHPGVIGIVASRVVERFHRPTLVLSVDPATGLATGSGRSIPGFHLTEALSSMDGIFERFGGHAQAAGCTVRADRIETLRRGLNDFAANVLGPEDFIPIQMLDGELPFAEITDGLMQTLEQLAPHGIGNPSPVFYARDLQLLGEPRILKDKHLKLRLRQAGTVMTAIGWRMAPIASSIRSGAALEAAFGVEWDDYSGGWRLNLKDLRES